MSGVFIMLLSEHNRLYSLYCGGQSSSNLMLLKPYVQIHYALQEAL